MMHHIKEINDYITHFNSVDLERVYNYVVGLVQLNACPDDRPVCPYCEQEHIIKWGFRNGKQRFLCKNCERTFMQTTNTVMSHSHYDRKVWYDFIEDTLNGKSLDESAKRFGFSHQTAFNMRHKILMAIFEINSSGQEELSGVSELDETYVLESYKGRRIPETAGRKARKHGAVALKRGISNEQICICTGVQRHGNAFAMSVNRAKPSIIELHKIFAGRIAPGTLLLVDGLRGYDSLESIADCSVKNVNTEKKSSIYNLNTINNFHSFIKSRYNAYRGVATIYLNRYNAMFGLVYRNTKEAVSRVFSLLCNVGSIQRWSTVRDVKSKSLLSV